MELDIWTIVSTVLGVVAVVFGGIWAQAKGKLAEAKTLLSEGVDVLEAVTTALGDNKLSKEEVEAIKKEGLEFVGAWKKLIGK